MQTQNVNDVIDHLAAKLSVPATHLWGVLVRQQRYEMISGLIWSVAWVAAAVFVWRLAPKITKWGDEGGAYSDRDFAVGIYYGVRAVSLVVAFIVVAINVSNVAGILYNPEYYALKQLLEALSSAASK